MDNDARYVANPLIVLREEFDDWAVLFDPDTGDAHGLDPVGVLVWRLLDGKHTPGQILAAIRDACEDVPADAPTHLTAFLDDLLGKGYIAPAQG